jgi:hypothetical protein
MKRTLLTAATMAVVLSLSGCGGAKAGATKESAQQKRQDAQLAFSQCMRDNGVTGFPDPKFGDGGGGSMMIDSSSGIDPDSDSFKAAQSKCQPALDKVMGDGAESRSPAEQQEMKDQALAYAQCMRDNGVDMPDPTFDDQGHVQMRVGGGPGAPEEINKEKMDKAQEACRGKQPMGGSVNSTDAGPGKGPSTVIGGGN